MKGFRILAVVLALVLVLGMALPALAQGPPDTDGKGPKPVKPFERGKPPFASAALAKFKTIKGTVEAVAADKITVDGYELFIEPDSRFKVPTLSKAAALADIKVGMLVIVLVYEKDGKLYIRHIVVIPGKPVLSHNVGKVVEFDYDAQSGEDGSITIETKKGTFTFEILAGKFKVLPEGADVNVGSLVTVISPRDPATNRLIAVGVVVHSALPKPPPVETTKVTGVINEIDETSKTIIIGETPVTYTETTLFITQGQLSVEVDQEAVAFCIEKEDGTLVALRILVGVDLPHVMAQLGAELGKTERDGTGQED